MGSKLILLEFINSTNTKRPGNNHIETKMVFHLEKTCESVKEIMNLTVSFFELCSLLVQINSPLTSPQLENLCLHLFQESFCRYQNFFFAPPW